MVNTPTRGSNILDIFVTNRPTLVKTCDTIDGISDHEAVLVVSSIIANLYNPSKRVVYLWAQADFNAIRNNMQSLCDNFLNCFLTSIPVEVLWNEFLSIVILVWIQFQQKLPLLSARTPGLIATSRDLLVESSEHTTRPTILTCQQTGPSSWNEHIQWISNKANQVNNFLRRNLHECPIDFKTIVIRWWFDQLLNIHPLSGPLIL